MPFPTLKQITEDYIRNRMSHKRKPYKKRVKPEAPPAGVIKLNGRDQDNPFPQQMRNVFVNGDIRTSLASCTHGALQSTFAITLNSLLDPYLWNDSNHKCRGYDTFLGATDTEAPYSAYRVTKAKVEIDVFTENEIAEDASPVAVVICPRAQSGIYTGPSSYKEVLERTDCYVKFLSQANQHVRFKKTFDIGKICSINKEWMKIDPFTTSGTASLYSNSPTTMAVLDLYIVIIGEAPNYCFCTCKLKQDTMLFKPNDISTS